MPRRFVLLFFFLASTLAAAKPNIVLITISSANKLSSALAHDSLIFDRAYAQSPETISSTATILTGTYPQTHHAGELGGALAPTLPFLSDLLHGYRSAAFVSTIQLDPKNGSAQGFRRGFASYDAGFHQAAKGESRFVSVERRAPEVVARATAWLAQNSKSPFFLWVQLNDSGDVAIAKLFATLKTQKLYDDSLVVIAADHGQSLGAHGEDSHGIFLYDETVHVPLLLKMPQNQNAGKKVQARVGLIDIAPTILEVAGIPVPSQMQGQSLLRSAKSESDRPAYSRSDLPQRAFGWSPLESWRAGKYLYIRAPKPELYDLTLDPGAKKNLSQSSKATLDTMAAQLNAFDARFTAQAGKSTELTSTEMQKLASLGYVGLQKSPVGGTAVTGVDPKDTIDIANKVFAAIAFLNDGKPDRALATLPMPLPNAYLAQYAAGAALAQQQQYPQAVARLHQAIELQPDSAWAHYQMGLCLLKTADYKTAAVHLEIATNRLPDFAAAHDLLAQAYDHLGRAEDARRQRSKTK
jgi:arylsulfatase A-like enzyme